MSTTAIPTFYEANFRTGVMTRLCNVTKATDATVTLADGSRKRRKVTINGVVTADFSEGKAELVEKLKTRKAALTEELNSCKAALKVARSLTPTDLNG